MVVSNMVTDFSIQHRGVQLSLRSTLFLGFFGALLACSACSSTPLLMTKQVKFRCDSKFNDGLLLPVDLVFIPEGEKIDTITGVAPDEWFDSEVRADWPYIQSFSFRESDVRNTIEIKLKKAKKTVAMVIIADYRGLEGAKSQIIVFKGEDSKEHEDIFITINGLLH